MFYTETVSEFLSPLRPGEPTRTKGALAGSPVRLPCRFSSRHGGGASSVSFHFGMTWILVAVEGVLMPRVEHLRTLESHRFGKNRHETVVCFL